MAIQNTRPRILAAFTHPANPGYITLAYATGGLSAYWFIERVATF